MGVQFVIPDGLENYPCLVLKRRNGSRITIPQEIDRAVERVSAHQVCSNLSKAREARTGNSSAKGLGEKSMPMLQLQK